MENEKKEKFYDWEKIEDIGLKVLLTSTIFAIPVGSAVLMYFVTKM